MRVVLYYYPFGRSIFMLGLTKNVDYGLDLMIFLGKNFGKGPISLSKVAKEKKIPYKFLGKLALILKQAGLIEAKEGKGGGYFLTVDPSKISVADVVEVLGGPVEVGHCSGCPRMGVCGQKDVWAEVGDKVRETIEEKSLKDLL